jgi:hypothetical protein
MREERNGSGDIIPNRFDMDTTKRKASAVDPKF